MDIAEIIIGRRHRKDLGDMEELKRSISELGLLQPIVVRKGTRELVAGYRRLKALEELGIGALMEGIHISLIDIDSLVRGEHDENVCRKDFTLSEKVAIFEAVKEEQLRISIAKQITGGCGPTDLRIKDRDSGDLPAASGSDTPGMECTGDPENGMSTEARQGGKRKFGQARSHAAKAVGLHQNTLRKATEIVTAARKEPGRYGHLVREMDLTGKVEPIFQKYVQEKLRPANGRYGMCPSLSRLLSDPESGIPEFLCSAMANIPGERQEDLVRRFAGIFSLVKRSDFDRGVKSYSHGEGLAELSDEEIYRLLRDTLDHTEATANEWVFMPQVRQVASLVMNVARARGSATTLDKLDFFMIGLAGFVDMACNYLHVANKDGIIKELPADALERYLAAIDAFQMLYESKLPRQVGALRMRECELRPGEMPDTKSLRDHANAMKANEMITDAAEGEMPYYRDMIAGLLQNLREGAQGLNVRETR